MENRPSVIVTGSCGGIGRALVAAFEAAGWDVVTTDRAASARAQHVQGDLALAMTPQSQGWKSLVEGLGRYTDGRLKAIIHNAAYQVVKGAEALIENDWSRTLAVNVSAPFWLTKEFLPELVRNSGSVVAISSIHQELTKPGFVAYATSKAALSGLMRAFAVDLGGRVRFNAICPAAIETEMLLDGFKDAPGAYEELKRFHPAGRIGKPEEVAAMARFLCSDEAEFVTGSTFDLSGGISARLHDPV